MHPGLIVIVPSVERALQMRLFELACDAIEARDDLMNKLVEVLADGAVYVRDWSRSEHHAGHISAPEWG